MTIYRSIHLASMLAFSITVWPVPASAQKIDNYSPSDLASLSRSLAGREVSKNGIASIMLQKYPGHFTEIILRHQSGEAELHKNMADFFVVVGGTAMLRSGGTILKPRDIGPGEVHGSSIDGGQETTLEKGSIVHIPANVPHQLLLQPGQSFTYFVIKVDEARAAETPSSRTK